MASWSERVVVGLASDLELWARGSFPTQEESKSPLLSSLYAALKAWSEVELSEKESEREQELIKELSELGAQEESASEEIMLEYSKSVQALASKKLSASKLVGVLAKLESERSEKLSASERNFSLKRKSASEELSALQNKRELSAQAACVAVLGKSKSKSASKSKRTTILQRGEWLIGPHVNNSSARLRPKDNKSEGVFALRGSDRELWFLPEGDNYKSALNRPAGLDVGEWVKLGNMVDHKSTRTKTGIQRFCYDLVAFAHEEKSASELIERVNKRALNDNLTANCGGVVNVQELSEESASEYSFPGFSKSEESASEE